MHQNRLNDAALALAKIFEEAGVNWGLFGGCAIALRGGPRESKDLDILAILADKAMITALLDGKSGFHAMPTSRQDVATFIWNDKDTSQFVTVEVFVGPQSIRPLQTVQVTGLTQGSGTVYLLDEIYTFRGKLRACATRAKHSDAADIVWMENTALAVLRANAVQFNLLHVGLALKRYQHLRYAFQRIGIDVVAAEGVAKDVTLESVMAAKPGDVLEGLLG